MAIMCEMAIMRDMAILGEMAMLVEMAIFVGMAILAHLRFNRCLHAKERTISYRTVLSRASGVPWGSRFDLGLFWSISGLTDVSMRKSAQFPIEPCCRELLWCPGLEIRVLLILAHFRLNRCLHAKERTISYRTALSRASVVPWGSRFDFGSNDFQM